MRNRNSCETQPRFKLLLKRFSFISRNDNNFLFLKSQFVVVWTKWQRGCCRDQRSVVRILAPAIKIPVNYIEKKRGQECSNFKTNFTAGERKFSNICPAKNISYLMKLLNQTLLKFLSCQFGLLSSFAFALLKFPRLMLSTLFQFPSASSWLSSRLTLLVRRPLSQSATGLHSTALKSPPSSFLISSQNAFVLLSPQPFLPSLLLNPTWVLTSPAGVVVVTSMRLSAVQW